MADNHPEATDPPTRDAALEHRALSFGSQADLYDLARPTYPPALLDELLAGDPRAVLDVGCGTGRVARALEGPGRRVLGIEPDERMAAVAARWGVEVEIGTFETWDPAGRRFNLLTSGQAWHWVDPVAGAAKAAEVLVPGGRFAAFWNVMHHRRAVRVVFDTTYGRHAPALLVSSVALGAGATVAQRASRAAAALAAAPFVDVTEERTTYDWQAEYTPEAWIALLQTHSDHEILPAPTRDALLDDLRAGLAGLGPTFPVDFRTELLQAIRA